MAHPYAKQSASSTARRMRVIGKSDGGKAWGSTATNKRQRKSYPSKNAGSQVPYFAEGGSVRPRADRLATGGATGGGKKHTTVIVNVAQPQDTQAAQAAPVAPVAAAAAPVVRPGPAMAMAGGLPPVGAVPPGALPGGPPLPPPGLGLRPPMAKRGGTIPRAQFGAALPPAAPPMPMRRPPPAAMAAALP